MHIYLLSMISSPRNKRERNYPAMGFDEFSEACPVTLYATQAPMQKYYFSLCYTKHISKVNMLFQS